MHHLERNSESTACPTPAPSYWAASYTHRECSLHQLSPYIGKLKSVIARDLIMRYSQPGELVVDMFCGSGTVPLEAAQLGRRVFASDTSLYAVTLTKGKLNAPRSIGAAVNTLDKLLGRADRLPLPDLRSIPLWVRSFFHPRTLKEALRLFRILKRERRHFLLASLLGILHHQRPGFLSYPSSHLVPYLRSEKFPKSTYPELYEYRSVTPRLQAKVSRVLKRTPQISFTPNMAGVRLASAKSVNLPENIDCVVTSPPYMNALDYRRDNRLRLWFLGEALNDRPDHALRGPTGFRKLMDAVAAQLSQKVRPGGYCVFVVGEQTFRGGGGFPSDVLIRSFSCRAPRLRLAEIVTDIIPDLRRSRRYATGVKRENVLVFRKH